MRFHVVNLPHTLTTKEYCWCAYTSKVLRFCNMMMDCGHEVFLYGGSENEARCTEFVEVISDKLRSELFGHYDWDSMVFSDWNAESPSWSLMNVTAVREISKRSAPGDFLCIIGGTCQAYLKKELPQLRAVEWGIGYEGIIHDAFHVFESYAWMHHIYGKYNVSDGRFFDTVIPNAFDHEDYEFSAKKDDYLLYLGRLTPRKGLAVVQELAKRFRVVTAGQGDIRIDGAEHRGVVRGKEKADLLANARAVLVPTFYIEPFGGVAVEAMISGTPVITTDFGAFTETVDEGVTGYRCHTLGDFVSAVENCDGLNPYIIKRHAEKYLTYNVQYEYDTYFKRLQLLDKDGWYST